MQDYHDNQHDVENSDRRLIGANLFLALKDLATNVVQSDEVDFIISPHVCLNKRDWKAFAESYTQVLLPSVTDHFAETLEPAEAEKTARDSIGFTLQGLIQQDKFVQPNIVLTPEAGPIALDHLITNAYGRHTWYHAEESHMTSYTTDTADIAPQTSEMTVETEQFEKIATYCDEYKEAKSIINWIGIETPKQITIAGNLKHLMDSRLISPRSQLAHQLK